MKQILSSLIQALLKKHPLLTPMVLAGFFFGVGAGAINARGLDPALVGQAEALFLAAGSGSFSDILLQTCVHTLLPLALLFLFAWSAIGTPGCLLISAVRGFSLGFTICLAVRQWSNRGILFVLAALFPRVVVEIPGFLLFSIFSAGISVGLFKSLWGLGEHGIKPAPYLLLFLILLLLGLLFGCGFEYLQQLFISKFLS